MFWLNGAKFGVVGTPGVADRIRLKLENVPVPSPCEPPASKARVRMSPEFIP